MVGARHGGQVQSILARLRDLDRRYPNVGEIAFQLAWTCDILGRPDEARPYYEKAIALGLPPNELSGAYLGLGSTLRQLGDVARAVEVLENARAQFPDNREFEAFLALALHDAGRATEALQLALTLLVDTSEDLGISAYQRTLRYHLSQLRAPNG